MSGTTTLQSLLETADLLRLQVAHALDPRQKSAHGQYLTPLPVARLMAGFVDELPDTIRLLEPGAGVGSLIAAFVDEALGRDARPGSIDVTAYEIEPAFLAHLENVLSLCRDVCAAQGVTFAYRILAGDFLSVCEDASAARLFAAGQVDAPFNVAIMNPPYHKIASNGRARELLRLAGIETVNLYAGFMGLAARLLAEGGQFISITPRSFCNGPYFRPFRRFFLDRMSITRVHVFENRAKSFAEDEVLQENVILCARKGAQAPEVVISGSHAGDAPIATERIVPFSDVVHPTDREIVLHLGLDEADRTVAQSMQALTGTLADAGVSVSTGRVVSFRAKAHLRRDDSPDVVPLLHPQHFQHGMVEWPGSNGKKASGLARTADTDDLLIPGGTYVLIKRFTAKEEARRVVAALCETGRFTPGPVAVENHLNYLHQRGSGLPRELAIGLALFLNSSLFDLYFRQFSGHTQVNAADLRRMPFPTREQLVDLGHKGAGSISDQETIDRLCREVLFPMTPKEGFDPAAARTRVEQALAILDDLGLPRAQRNERSALTLLALLGLSPRIPWSKASRPLVGITEMMDYFKEHYGKDYAPNTRETVRRQTVHQFEDAGLAVSNPDDPQRPINSPHWRYQITEQAHALLCTYGKRGWKSKLQAYLREAGTLSDVYRQGRDSKRIPVTLALGRKIELSPGQHNELIKRVIDEFCPIFVPGGKVIYVGDTADKSAYLDEQALAALGVTFDEHSKLPDAVIQDVNNGWVLLIEAVTSHGPVNPKRHGELKKLFESCSAGLVFVTAFLSRADFAKYSSEISWETEVWVAEDPTHMIHFDGRRFLGPYL